MWKALVLAVGLCFSIGAWAAPVDINTADAPTIAKSLKGVGKKKAEAIVAYRKQNGPFKSADDLSKVDGIGAATVEKNRANITLSSARAASAPAKTK